MSEQQPKILNFNKLEDLFFCIDVLTRARFAIKSSETDLLADLDTMLASLTYVAQNPPQQVKERSPGQTDEKTDSETESSNASDDDSIVDLLTGEKIK